VTELTPEQLQQRMDEFGLTEQEARISIHLEIAEDLLEELMREGAAESGAAMLGNIVWRETHISEYFRALHRELAMRVLHRDYPTGWKRVRPQDEDEG
jgi:hypothetical protein